MQMFEECAASSRSSATLCMICRDLLVGSLAGVLNELVIDEKDKKEKVARRVFQLQHSKDPMTSVHQHTTSQGQRVVLVSTTDRLYVFSGTGSFEAMFARYKSPGKMHTFSCTNGMHTCANQDQVLPRYISSHCAALEWLHDQNIHFDHEILCVSTVSMRCACHNFTYCQCCIYTSQHCEIGSTYNMVSPECIPCQSAQISLQFSLCMPM